VTPTIDDYKADYFVAVTRTTLDGPLRDSGFGYAGCFREVELTWSSGSVSFSVEYLPETSPEYELQFSVGIGRVDPDEPRTSADSVAVWRLLPNHLEHLARRPFDGPQALRAQLLDVWTQVVLPYAGPLWSDEARLAALIDEQNAQIAEEDQRFMDERLLRHARAEFRAGRHAAAVNAYDDLPRERLTAADVKRLEIARRRS
jgi:hypothetical protein